MESTQTAFTMWYSNQPILLTTVSMSGVREHISVVPEHSQYMPRQYQNNKLTHFQFSNHSHCYNYFHYRTRSFDCCR